MAKSTKLKKLFLDVNVAVKLLNGYKVEEVFEDPENSEIYISAISFNILCYLWETNKIECKKSELDNFFKYVKVLLVDENACYQALQLSNYKDIEDAIQIMCAQEHNMDMFLTYDKKLFSKYYQDLDLKILLCT